MKYFFYFINAFILLSFTINTFAQTGTIRGTVIDKKYNEPLIGVAVQIEGTTIGSSTDLDGNFSFDVEKGTYTIMYSYISYAVIKIDAVVVNAGEVTIVNADMVEESVGIDEVVISATANKASAAAVDKMRIKSDKVVDGISSQTFKRSGDSNAAAAIKRVTGVSVEGGKHVYVRGLGDRYTKTILNGMDIPGLDPERNNLQMDIFPANLLDNIVVYKTFTPDLTGDFTGGLVDIATKDFPETATLTASFSTTYRPTSHFNDKFYLYKGGKADALGFDNGNRELPFATDTYIPSEVEDNPKLEELTRSFEPEMATSPSTNFLDWGVSVAGGNQIVKNKFTIGYNLAANYKKSSQFNEVVKINQFIYNQDLDSYNLQADKLTSGSTANKTYSWSVFGGMAIKAKKHKIALTLMRLQNAKKSATRQLQRPVNDGAEDREKTNLEFNQRAVNYLGLSGKHSFNRFTVEWKNALTYSTIEDPDIRFTVFNVIENNQYVFGDGSKAARIYRDLKELNESFRVDITVPFRFKGYKSKFKFGGANTFKNRRFTNQQFNLLVKNDFEFTLDGNPNWFLRDENIWSVENPIGTYLNFTEQKSNNYDALINIGAFYGMTELKLSEVLKITAGVRAELISHVYSGQYGEGSNAQIIKNIQLYDQDNINALAQISGQSTDYIQKPKPLKILPSIGLVYNLVDNTNLRASYYQTVARPSFREKSFTIVRDRLTNITYVGNILLQQTDIYNADVRFEHFFGRGEIVSVSAFYKHFNQPIEVVANELASNELKARNTDSAQMLGVEFEARKNFGFISESLDNLSMGTNLTLVRTSVKMNQEEINARNTNLRNDEPETKTTRAMFGQSPYIINAYLNYTNPEKGFDANLSYNVQGKRIAVVGLNVPDVYEQSFHSLNFKTSYKFSEDNRCKVSFSVDNILGQTRVKKHESYNTPAQVFSSVYNGRAYTFGFSYSL